MKSQDIRFLVEMPENWFDVQLGDYDLKVRIPNKTIPILREAVEIVKHFDYDCPCERTELKSVEGNFESQIHSALCSRIFQNVKLRLDFVEF